MKASGSTSWMEQNLWKFSLLLLLLAIKAGGEVGRGEVEGEGSALHLHRLHPLHAVGAHGPVDRHGPAGKVLEVLDAGLPPQDGGGHQAVAVAPVEDPGVVKHLVGVQPCPMLLA